MIGRSRAIVLAGLHGHVVDVEAHIGSSLPAFTIVGLPDASLTEARDRVRAAVASSGLSWPQRRITVNLSPASLPKRGSATDLAIAVAVLAAAGMIDPARAGAGAHLGELGLDGRVRPIAGVLPAVAAAVGAGMPSVTVPWANADEARLVPGAEVHPVASLAELARAYGSADAVASASEPVTSPPVPAMAESQADLSEVRGQGEARWALEVAAAGGHHLLMTGPPGAGKTMLACRLPSVLPPLADADAVAATSIHSLSGSLDVSGGLMRRAPFEAPHHSASAAAIVGGGSGLARPGAISRAHAGVLFLDEAPEFPARVLQTLRQPLESGEIVLHRASGATRYPARFQLVLAANPCPCGHFYGNGTRCTCSAIVRRRYFGRLSGPLLDRVDIQVDVHPVRRGADEPGESSAEVAARVARARERAGARLSSHGWSLNSQASGAWLRRHTPPRAVTPVWRALDTGVLSARGADRALRLAWTLADLREADEPGEDDVAQAMTLRSRGSAA
ncbi:YifB family Mg chelatase-like AAA ATPase [Demequina muriae]|uniref:YifB family Mg chelatase-like AAA ATPase n=1 Tax=Demequina muriae TaxID=3051664 RepID=A0ABT8GDV1_9MICO|nr:YifB family Mg chelatase-like AAA ATPase [Demequina sp. EGI L300058]MDN4479607.1 YifB family Mg chelatase-like AAA ATPase [Demequina sp. EGI L300058]